MAQRDGEGAVAPALLFDRLVDLEPWHPREPRPLRTLDREQLEASVKAEVSQLLNTRCSLSVAEAESLAPHERTVLDYGVPDMGWMSPASGEDQARIARVLAQALAAFEPRLRGPRVTVDRFDAERRLLYVAVSASLVVGRLTEPVSFKVGLDLHGTRGETHGR
ncbi:type VI secretion system baseplate subunit TssE [Archangium sp.]|jgi:type VI secretion system lysozyme-like protein|uniref:type VI secretion system baseplate subunit TssE n=1 Tax=Archangium sp. TaxID=1872627 RepID=UPI002ED8ACC2